MGDWFAGAVSLRHRGCTSASEKTGGGREDKLSPVSQWLLGNAVPPNSSYYKSTRHEKTLILTHLDHITHAVASWTIKNKHRKLLYYYIILNNTFLCIVISYVMFSSSKTTSPEITPWCTPHFEAIMLGLGRTLNPILELCMLAMQPGYMITWRHF